MRRLAASIVLTFSLSFGSTGRAAEEPKVTLEATLDSSSRVVAPALPVPGDLVEPLFDGGTYVNVHTAANPNGEIRGQIHLKSAACSCSSGSAGALRKCVKLAIRARRPATS